MAPQLRQQGPVQDVADLAESRLAWRPVSLSACCFQDGPNVLQRFDRVERRFVGRVGHGLRLQKDRLDRAADARKPRFRMLSPLLRVFRPMLGRRKKCLGTSFVDTRLISKLVDLGTKFAHLPFMRRSLGGEPPLAILSLGASFVDRVEDARPV